jgi:predicted nuclease of predicted toxin-antitoxin system
MLRLLIDQDLDHVILRGLLLRVPNLDVITAHQVGLSNASDPEVLAWAAEHALLKRRLRNSENAQEA